MTSPRTESLVLPTQHLRMALRTLQLSPNVRKSLLRGTSISIASLDDPDFAFPATALFPLCNNASRIFGPEWFLNIPILWSIDAHSEFGMATRFAPSFGVALDVMVEFTHIRWPVIRTVRTVSKTGHTLTVTPTERTSLETWRTLASLALLSFQTVAKAVLERGTETIQYNFEGPPAPYATRLEELFEGNLSWGHERTGIFVPVALLSQISPLANRHSFAAMLGALRELASRQHHEEQLSVRVAQTLDGVITGRMDADEMARRLGVSKRTLERRLEREGTTFRELSTESLKSRFATLIKEPGLGTDVIADRLGFHDASSLLRACRRWFGASPSELRRRFRAS